MEEQKQWWEMGEMEQSSGKGKGKGDERPANQLHLLSPVFSQVAYIANLDAKAQQALCNVYWRLGIDKLAWIMPAPQQYLAGTAIILSLSALYGELSLNLCASI